MPQFIEDRSVTVNIIVTFMHAFHFLEPWVSLFINLDLILEEIHCMLHFFPHVYYSFDIFNSYHCFLKNLKKNIRKENTGKSEN